MNYRTLSTKAFVSLCLFIICSNINASSFLTKKQPSHLNIGTGITTWGVPFYAGVDLWALRNLTLGLEFQTRVWIYRSILGGPTTIGLNGNYQFRELLNLPTNSQLYAGGGFGVGFVPNVLANNTAEFSANQGVPLTGYFVLQAGYKYWLNRQTALMVEIMAGSYQGIKVGLTFNPFEKWK